MHLSAAIRGLSGGAHTLPEPVRRSKTVSSQAQHLDSPMLDMESCDSTKLGELFSCLQRRPDLIVKTFRSGIFCII